MEEKYTIIKNDFKNFINRVLKDEILRLVVFSVYKGFTLNGLKNENLINIDGLNRLFWSARQLKDMVNSADLKKPDFRIGFYCVIKINRFNFVEVYRGNFINFEKENDKIIMNIGFVYEAKNKVCLDSVALSDIVSIEIDNTDFNVTVKFENENIFARPFDNDKFIKVL